MNDGIKANSLIFLSFWTPYSETGFFIVTLVEGKGRIKRRGTTHRIWVTQKYPNLVLYIEGENIKKDFVKCFSSYQN